MRKILYCILLCFVASSATIMFGAKRAQAPDVAQSELQQKESEMDAWQKSLFYKAVDEVEKGNYDEALMLLEFLKNHDDNQAGIYALEGSVFERINYQYGAMLAWYTAYTQDSTNFDYAKHVIELMADKAEPSFLIDIMEKTTACHPDNAEAWYMLAYCYQLGTSVPNHNKKALKAYEQYERIEGVTPAVTKAKAQIYYEMGKKKKVVQTINQLINDNPDEDSYKVLLGDIYLRQKKLDEAYKTFMEVLAQYPKNPYVYISLAQYYQEKGDLEMGRKCLYEAINNPNLELNVKLEILSELSEKMTHSQANLAQFDSLLMSLRSQFPYEEIIIASQYSLYQSMQRKQDAYQAVKDMLDINPKNAKAWGALYTMTDDENERLAILENALQNVDSLDRYDFITERMLWYYRQNDYEHCKEDIDFCINAARRFGNYNSLANLYIMKGDLYGKLHLYDEAIDVYELAVKISPNNALILNNYAYTLSLRQRDGDLRRAERMSAKAVELQSDNAAYLDTYAWILYNQGSATLATFYMKKLLSLKDLDMEGETVYIEHAEQIYQASKDGELLKLIEKVKKQNEVNHE